jgi:hypothetical protein
MLADTYTERLRLEALVTKQTAQLEKQYLQLLELQRRSSDLQEKLQGLANIEHSLPRGRAR